MATREAFVCYVHADDDADRGRVLRLAEDIGAEYSAITGEPLTIIYDRMYLTWGDNWRDRLTEAVGSATFLIAIVTPRFFFSDECRRELEHFQKTAAQFGRSELVLPIIYIPVPDLHLDENDAARKLVASLQYENWVDLRFEDLTSGVYRRGVNRLALALVDRISTLADLQVVLPLPSPDEPADDSPGIFDAIAENDGAVEEMKDAIANIAELTTQIGHLMEESTGKFTTSTDPKSLFANRILVAGQLASAMTPIVDLFEHGVRRFRGAVDRTDLLLEAFFTLGTAPANRESSRALANIVIETADIFTQSFTNSDQFILVLRDIQGFTKALRGPTQRLRRATQSLRDTEPTILTWADDARELLTRLDELEQGPNDD